MRAHSPLRCGVSGAVPGGVLTLISVALLYLCLLLYGISDGSLLSRRGTDLAFDLSLCSEVGTGVCTGEGGREKRLVFAPRFRPLGVDDLVTYTKTDAPAVVHYSAKGIYCHVISMRPAQTVSSGRHEEGSTGPTAQSGT